MLSTILIGALAATSLQTDTTFAVRSGGRLRLENHQGSITVRTWNRDELRLRARHGNDVRIEIATTGRPASTVRVEGNRRRGGPSSIDYELTLPRQFSVALEGINLRIDVADLEGDVDAETVNGDVSVRGAAGTIRLESMQGSMSVTGSRGSLSADGTNQGITVDGFDGPIEASTVNGSVVLMNITSRAVEAETVNGRVEYGGTLHDDGRYSLSTHNGGVTLWVPDGTNASIDIETFAGSIDAEFPIEMRGGGRNRASFTVGSGRGARISIASFGGPIRIRRPR